MDMTFERGNPREPKGHALVYFRSSEDASRFLGSYLLVLPIPLDISIEEAAKILVSHGFVPMEKKWLKRKELHV